MACPNVNYGIGSGGATEYNINTGREMFRCGKDCVKVFIVNVTVEKTNVKIEGCGELVAGGDKFCVQNVSGTIRPNYVVNWTAKNGANSSLENGSVLNKVGSCDDGRQDRIFTHTEGSLNTRCYISVEDISSEANNVRDNALTMLDNIYSTELKWYLNDVGVTASPNDWQGASLSYMGITSNELEIRRDSFNNMNGLTEIGLTELKYDDTDDTSLDTVLGTLIS